MRVALRVAERIKTYLSGISQNFIELQPSARSTLKMKILSILAKNS